MGDPILYPAVHTMTVKVRGGGSYSSSYPTVAEAMAAADASNIEYKRQPGDFDWAYVTTEYSRDDGIPGALWRWRLRLDANGNLSIPEYADIRVAFKRGDAVEPDSDDMNPTIQVWNTGTFTDSAVHHYEITVVAATRAGALADARALLEAAQTPAHAAEVIEAPSGSTLGIGARSPRPTYTMNLEFPTTSRGYPYEGPSNTPGSSNAMFPDGSTDTLAHRLDADLSALADGLAEARTALASLDVTAEPDVAAIAAEINLIAIAAATADDGGDGAGNPDLIAAALRRLADSRDRLAEFTADQNGTA